MPKIKKKAYKLRHSYLQAIGIVLILFFGGFIAVARQHQQPPSDKRYHGAGAF